MSRMMVEFEIKEDRSILEMPSGAIPRNVVLRVPGNGTQSVIMWVELDDDCRLSKRTFGIIEPNQPIPENAHYIGTVEDGRDSWHVFEFL